MQKRYRGRIPAVPLSFLPCATDGQNLCFRQFRLASGGVGAGPVRFHMAWHNASIAAVIHQDLFLFDDTICNNICLFYDFSEQNFQRALQLSGVSKYVDQFEYGVDHQVGQLGEFLPADQQQRVPIARALIYT